MREKTSIFSGTHKAEGSWVADLPKITGRSIYERFVVCSKPEIRKTKKGDYFLTVELGDKTGRVKLLIWQVPEFEQTKALALFCVNKVYAIEATVGEYNAEPQLSVNWTSSLRHFECQFDEEPAKSDYFQADFQMIKENATVAPVGEMVKYFFAAVEGIKHPGFSGLLKKLFQHELFDYFSRWPAAQKYHHAYFHGLLEHVYEMLKAAESFVVAYPNIDADLLRTGIILHDIGKLEEYKLERQIECDEEAFLIGHMVIAVRMIEDAAAEVNISRDDLNKLFHLILSHHGDVELGFGSAVSPKLPEAIALYHLDQLSAKVNAAYVKDRK